MTAGTAGKTQLWDLNGDPALAWNATLTENAPRPLGRDRRIGRRDHELQASVALDRPVYAALVVFSAISFHREQVA